MSTPTDLSPTTAALLGLLSQRPRWTTYELTKEMRRNLRFFWPRAESRIYAQAKALTDAGLARAEKEVTGRRPRTVYEITPAGERALRAWLATPSTSMTTLQSEGLVRVLCAAHGPREGLVDALRRMRDDAEATLEVGATIADEFLAGAHPFQDEIHVRQFVHEYLVGFAAHTRDWATRALEDVEAWETTEAPDDTTAALARVAETMRRAKKVFQHQKAC
jgi:PadR family transcriptional regulator AphA